MKPIGPCAKRTKPDPLATQQTNTRKEFGPRGDSKAATPPVTRQCTKQLVTPATNRGTKMTKRSCARLLNQLCRQPSAWPFLQPVDPEDVPLYAAVIQHPMDFRTIRRSLKLGEYMTLAAFHANIELVFSNCFLFNQKGSPVHQAGQQLQKVYQTLLQPRRSSRVQRSKAPSREQAPSNETCRNETHRKPVSTGSRADPDIFWAACDKCARWHVVDRLYGNHEDFTCGNGHDCSVRGRGGHTKKKARPHTKRGPRGPGATATQDPDLVFLRKQVNRLQSLLPQYLARRAALAPPPRSLSVFTAKDKQDLGEAIQALSVKPLQFVLNVLREEGALDLAKLDDNEVVLDLNVLSQKTLKRLRTYCRSALTREARLRREGPAKQNVDTTRGVQCKAECKAAAVQQDCGQQTYRNNADPGVLLSKVNNNDGEDIHTHMSTNETTSAEEDCLEEDESSEEEVLEF